MFFVSSLAETNRPPFDLPEAERASLLRVIMLEYSAVGFALFFIAEYTNIILLTSINALLFFGGWLSPLSLFSNSDFFSWPSMVNIKSFMFIVFIRMGSWLLFRVIGMTN
jgi:NADH-quinone oxidoreductase subunit H